MDDSDDDTAMLEDIKALENVLAMAASSESSSEDDEENEALSSPETISPSPENDPQRALELNQALLNKLMVMKEKLGQRLQDIDKEKEDIEVKIKNMVKEVRTTNRMSYGKAGFPYFKDKDCFPAPLNEDAILKRRRNELMIVYTKSPSRWTVKDRNILWSSIKAEAATKFLKQQPANKASGNGESDDNKNLPKDLKGMIGPLGSREFDWLKIAAQDFNNRHTAEECKVMWNAYLHPDINHRKFSSAEDRNLLAIAKTENFQNWDLISLNLATGRTGYQCFIRFTTIVGSINLKNKDVTWTSAENNILVSIVERVRIGSYIPWGYVAFYLGNKGKNQVYCHWKYNLDPSLKKGRFTTDEDELLLEGAMKYGRDFPRISAELIPHRTSVQLSGRFTLLMLKTDRSYNSWTVAEDMQLLQLHDQLGSQWSKIAGIMDKNRTYLRHRYNAIRRYLASGKNLENIPRTRKRSRKQMEENDNEVEDVILVSNVEVENELDVDTKLRRYFARNHAPIAPSGGQSPYKSSRALDKHTKQLYDIFNNFKVSLEIPENIDEISELTLKDKQLLNSYKKYSQGTENSRSTRDIENLRLKMFGPDDNSGTRPPFIAPPPFGLCFKKPTKKSSQYDKTTSENTQLELDFELEVPENINKMLSNDEQKIFDKLSSLVSIRSTRTAVEAVEEKCMSINGQDGESDLITPIGITSISWGKKVGQDVDRTAERQKASLLKPCYSTLLGYETLRHMKELNANLEWSRSERAMSKQPVSMAGKRAFHSFKSRFGKIFKYPIGMVRAAETKSSDSNIIAVATENTEQYDEDSS